MVHNGLKPWSWLLAQARRLITKAYYGYRRLHILGKLLVWVFILFNIVLVTLLITIGPKAIAQTIYNVAQKIKHHPYGWLFLAIFMVITSFPPLVGYSSTVSICGFAYGVQGFLLAGPAAVVGSAIVFVVLRFFFRDHVQRLTSTNDKWKAFESVIRSKGLPLIILIRLSPLPPWVYANALLASVESVALWQFVIATICLLPKIFLTVFVSSRVALLSDGDSRGEMDTVVLVLNGVSIVVGVLIGVGTGWLVYRLVRKEIRTLHDSCDPEAEQAVDILDDVEAGAPLLREFSSESLDTPSS